MASNLQPAGTVPLEQFRKMEAEGRCWAWREQLRRLQRQLKAKEDQMSRQSMYFDNFKTQLQHKLASAGEKELSLQNRIYVLEKQLLELTVNSAAGVAVRITAGNGSDRDGRSLSARGEGEGEEERNGPNAGIESDGREGKDDGRKDEDSRQKSNEARLRGFIWSLQEDLRALLDREERGLKERRELTEQLREAQEEYGSIRFEMDGTKAEVRHLRLAERSLLEEVEKLREENRSFRPDCRCASDRTSESTPPSPKSERRGRRTFVPSSVGAVRQLSDGSDAKIEPDCRPPSPATPLGHHQAAAESSGFSAPSSSAESRPEDGALDLFANFASESGLQPPPFVKETLDDFISGSCRSPRGFFNLEETPSEESDALRDAYKSLGFGEPLESLREKHGRLEPKIRATSPENAKSKLRLRTEERTSVGDEVTMTTSRDGVERADIPAGDDLVHALNRENRALASRIGELLDRLELSDREVRRLEMENEEQGCLVTELTKKTEDDLNAIMELRQKLEESEERRDEDVLQNRSPVALDVVEQLTDSIQDLKSEQEELIASVSSLRGERKEAALSVRAKTDEKHLLTRTVWRLKDEKDRVSRVLEGFGREKELLARTVCGLKDERDRLLKSVYDLKEERERTAGCFSTLRAEEEKLPEEEYRMIRSPEGSREGRDEFSLKAEGDEPQEARGTRTRRSSVSREDHEKLLISVSALKEEKERLERSVAGLKQEEVQMKLIFEALKRERKKRPAGDAGEAASLEGNITPIRSHGKRELGDLEKELEGLREELKSSREEVKELQRKLSDVTEEKAGALLLKAQIDEQHNILSAQLKAKTVALEELNSEYIALRKGRSCRDDLSALVASLRTRYYDVKVKYDALLKKKILTDTNLAPLKAKISCLVLKCQERNKLLGEMMKTLRERGFSDAALKRRVHQLLSDAALDDYAAEFASGSSANTPELSRDLTPGFLLKFKDYTVGSPSDPASSAAVAPGNRQRCGANGGEENEGKHPSPGNAVKLRKRTGDGFENDTRPPVSTPGEDGGHHVAPKTDPSPKEDIDVNTKQLPPPDRQPVKDNLDDKVDGARCSSAAVGSSLTGVTSSRTRSCPEKILGLHEQLQQTLLSSYEVTGSRGATAILAAADATKQQSFNIQSVNPLLAVAAAPNRAKVTSLPTTTSAARNKSMTLLQAVAARSAPIPFGHDMLIKKHRKEAVITDVASSEAADTPISPATPEDQANDENAPPCAAASCYEAADSKVPKFDDQNPRITASCTTAPSLLTAPKADNVNTVFTTESIDEPVFTSSCTQAANARRSPIVPVPPKTSKVSVSQPADVTLVEVIREVGQSCLLIGWERPPLDELGCNNGVFVYGYRVFVDGIFHKSVMSSACTKCVLENVDLSVPIQIGVQTLGSNGQSSNSVHASYTSSARTKRS